MTECRNVFWGHTARHPPIAWKQMRHPKKKRGLLVLDRHHVLIRQLQPNQHAWKILTDMNNWTWVKLIKQKYLRTETFFTVKKKQHKVISNNWNLIVVQAFLDVYTIIHIRACATAPIQIRLNYYIGHTN